MNFDLSNTRDWRIPGGDGVQLSALKVVDGLGRVIWKKYYLVNYDNNVDGTQYWTIRYYANGGHGSMTATTVDKGAAVALRTNAFARSGYSFGGWNTKPAGGGSSYSDGQVVTPGSDWALYAQWVAAGHTVLFYANGGTGDMPPINASYNSWVDIPECGFTRTGYAFSEWACEIDGEYTIYSDQDQFLMPDDDVVLSAQWTVLDFTVTFDPNGGTVSPTSKTVTYGQTYGSLPTPTRAATGLYTYTFTGWFTDATGGSQVTASSTVLITDAQTLYAHWTQTANLYTVTVSPGTGGAGGAGFTYYASESSQTKTITLPARTGYKITGWTFTGYAGTSPSASGSAVTIPANTYGDITMTPTWGEDYITITFDSNEG